MERFHLLVETQIGGRAAFPYEKHHEFQIKHVQGLLTGGLKLSQQITQQVVPVAAVQVICS